MGLKKGVRQDTLLLLLSSLLPYYIDLGVTMYTSFEEFGLYIYVINNCINAAGHSTRGSNEPKGLL